MSEQPQVAIRPQKVKVTWRAGADKTRHAHAPRATRTLCGEQIVPEYLAHEDAVRKCAMCLTALEPDRLAL